MSFVSTYPTNVPKLCYTTIVVIETITAKSYPILYLPKPVKAKELVSKVSRATIIRVSADFPTHLEKKGRAKDLVSKF